MPIIPEESLERGIKDRIVVTDCLERLTSTLLTGFELDQSAAVCGGALGEHQRLAESHMGKNTHACAQETFISGHRFEYLWRLT